MARSPALLAALVIHSIVVGALALGAVMLIVASQGAMLFISSLLLFLGLILAAMLALAVAGAVGMWRGDPRGYRIALATQLVLALVLVGFAVEASERGLNAMLPSLVGIGLVLTSTILLLLPAARDEFGLDDIAFLDPDEDPPLAVRGIVVALVVATLVMNVALQALAIAVSFLFGLLTLELDVLGMLFEAEYFTSIVLFLAPGIVGAWGTWRERRWGWWALVVAHAGGALFFVLAAQSAWGRAYDPADLLAPVVGGALVLVSSVLLALPSTREWASL